MSKEDKYPCMCGHTKIYHRRDIDGDMCCNLCWDILLERLRPTLLNVDNMYHEFVVDNLLYLEQLSER